MLAIEGFADQGAARAAVSRLDRLRPHMARAIALSSQLQMERVRAAVEAFQVIGVPAATLDHGARIQTFNAKFAGAMGDILIETRGQMRLHNAADTALLASALERLRRTGQGSSLPIRDAGGVGRAALHIVPIAGDARDVFAGSACFVIVAGARNAQVPNTDLIQALFDMTPAEARVARAIALGKSPAEIASSSGLALATIRTQLKHIFQKTSTTRQSELASLLSAFRLP
jgi:DNA-binding CsgD family transcriptional regulator